MLYLTKIYIPNFQQFKDFELELTYQSGERKGQPLDKICFIGKNGTGKTTLLNAFIRGLLRNISQTVSIPMFFKINYNGINIYAVRSNRHYHAMAGAAEMLYLKEPVALCDINELEKSIITYLKHPVSKQESIQEDITENINRYLLTDNFYSLVNHKTSSNLLIYAPAEPEQRIL